MYFDKINTGQQWNRYWSNVFTVLTGTCWSIFLQSVVDTVTHWRQLEHTHLQQGGKPVHWNFDFLGWDLMVWISLVPQWRRMEVNIFGYLNGNCSMVPLFRGDPQVSIVVPVISIQQFLLSSISFTLPNLKGTVWKLIQTVMFCNLWTSQRNPLDVPVQPYCRATFPHTNECPNASTSENWNLQELFIE